MKARKKSAKATKAKKVKDLKLFTSAGRVKGGRKGVTTMALGEEGDGGATTMALGEEGQ